MPEPNRAKDPIKHARRFIPPISLEHILLTELINAPSPVTPQPETRTTPNPPEKCAESTKTRMAITELMNEDMEPVRKKVRLDDEPVTPIESIPHLENPLPPLRLATTPIPATSPLETLHPPLPRQSTWKGDGLPTTEVKKRKYVCKLCNFGFHQAGGLKNHMNAVHLKQKPYACDWPGCGRYGERGFAARGDLTRHVSSVHKGERNFRCERCDMRFARRSVLVRHLRNIHKVSVPGRREGRGSGSS